MINIEVPDADIERRIVERRTCKGCGAIFHLSFHPPAKAGVCDACGGELSQRADDTAEVVRTRLKEYHEKTSPLVEFYRDRSGICTVDGRNTPDQVFEACLACFGVRLEAVRASRGSR
ncbi:MAG: nucleoside monophosphate kinase [Planctomycetota bacterium]